MKNDPTIDFPAWYQEVITKAQLSENGPARGTVVIRPYAYRIWELMQADMDRRIKEAGAENAYFPLFIPQSYLARESDHIEGFSPELAVVTHAGGSKLDEPLVVRPTSETVIGEYMGKWVKSYRDLPLLLNQWANVVRWEKRPRAFLRTTEFLWQEGHTAHVDRMDAARYARRILDEVYEPFMREMLAITVYRGQKSPSERFAGAINTMTCEAMMGDGKALQMGTSHELGTNFASAFNVRYLASTGSQELAWTTSWGSSTRMLGGLFMAHGDKFGLRLPPNVAPFQVVIVQIGDVAEVAERVARLAELLAHAGVRVKIDQDHSRSVGARLTDWELKGVPLRVDFGARELEAEIVGLVRRDSRQRQEVPIAAVADIIPGLLDDLQKSLLADATSRRNARTYDVRDTDEAAEAAQTGFARVQWRALRGEGEVKLRSRAITVRCISSPDGDPPHGEPTDESLALVARAY